MTGPIAGLRARITVGTVLAVTVLVAAAGCASLPDSGPVHTAAADQAAAAEGGGFDYQPRSPLPDGTPDEIVDGFLDAMRETPLTFAAARQFLTDGASTRWTPSKHTLVYADGSLSTDLHGAAAQSPAQGAARVEVRIGSADQLDARGGWQGTANGGRPIDYDLRLVKESGQWRISNPPDALIVSRNHFDTRYLRFNLYFFEPTGHVLVPEPVYLPAGVTVPTLLVDGLLQGPSTGLRSVERTFVPDGTKLDISVPVVDEVAQVPLSREFLDINGDRLDRALAQIAWTLRQVPGVERMRVTVDDNPVQESTGASARAGWASYDPALTSASQELFGIRGRTVVSVDVRSGASPVPLTRAFAQRPLRALAISLDAEATDARAAGVSADGRQLLETARVQPQSSRTAPRTVYAGTDLSEPSYDLHGFLWVADNPAGGARLRVVREDRWRTLAAPGIEGGEVSSVRISRDGTRLAALVGGRVLVARITRNQQGRPTGISSAVQVGTEQLQAVASPGLGIAFATPSTLGVLVSPGPGTAGVTAVSVDGSFVSGRVDNTPETLFESGQALVTWPGASAPVFLQAGAGKLYRLTSTGHWDPADLPTLRLPTFPG